jgi:hypothetical protein
MESLTQLSREDIRRGLKEADLRTTLIVQMALVVGPVLFFAVVFGLHVAGTSSPARGSSGFPVNLVLLPMLGVFSLAMLAVYVKLPDILLKPASLKTRLETGQAGTDPIAWMVGLHRAFTIMRLAVTEAAALFGLAILLMAVMDGTSRADPVVWVSGAPLAIHVLAGLLNLPTRESVTGFIENRIVRPLRDAIG